MIQQMIQNAAITGGAVAIGLALGRALFPPRPPGHFRERR
jgi:hypothetical protein